MDGLEPSRPRRIAGFRIVRLLGSGGMGSVFEAEQDHPRRAVALKVLERNLTSRAALRRFEVESETLARLRHPGIAQVYESGTHVDAATGASAPWFAMEFVPDALGITEFAAERALDLRAKLELFCRVCDAVEHGHRHGVIHRDLKPANILVDGSGQPKVIDFGVARAAVDDPEATMVLTEAGQLLGTVPYMSPEQCAADPGGIDTRSDIYALGVVLYELLAGRMPYGAPRGNVAELVRAIREDAPLRLSSTDTRLRGDVETIVHKALEKDRERRYASAGALASDIQRWLKSEPIQARPPSVGYQLATFARRNRAFVASLAVVFVTLVVGAAIAWRQAVRARDAERAALVEKEGAEAINQFYERMLGVVTGDGRGGRAPVPTTEAKVVDLLREASDRVPLAFPGQPALEVRARRALAAAFRGIGMTDEAETELRAAVQLSRAVFGPNADGTSAVEIELGGLLVEVRLGPRAREGLALLEAAAARLRATPDPRAVDAACWIGSAIGGARGESVLRAALVTSESLEERAVGASGRTLRSRPHVVRVLVALAELCLETERAPEADAFSQSALEASRHDDRATARDAGAALACRARVLSATGRDAESLSLARGALDAAGRVYGKHHAAYANALEILLDALWRTGRKGEARRVAEAYDEDARLRLGEGSVAAQEAALVRARVLARLGQLDAAEALTTRAGEVLSKRGVLSALRARALEAEILLGRGRADEAQAVVSAAIDRAEAEGLEAREWLGLLRGVEFLAGRHALARARFDDAERALSVARARAAMLGPEGEETARTVALELDRLAREREARAR